MISRLKTAAILTMVFGIFMGTPLAAADIRLKFSGGIGLINPQSINLNLQGWRIWQQREAENKDAFLFISGKTAELRRSSDFEGELLVSLAAGFSLSIGSGYLFSEVQGDQTEVRVEKVAGTYINIHPSQISAVPLILSVYYSFPAKGKLGFYARAGGGMIWADYADWTGRMLTTASKVNYPEDQKASASGPVFIAGLGISFNIESSFKVFAEADYRRAELKNFNGKTKDDIEGPLFSYEEYDADFDYWQYKLQVLAEMPSGEYIRSAEKAHIDLSGIMFRIGLMIRF